MKLLFDAMLSPKLVYSLADVFPGNSHVFDFGIQGSDSLIWDFARNGGFVIVTKDSDFDWRAEVYGPPPTVVRLRVGNCRSQVIDSLLRMYEDELRQFDSDGESALLVLPL